MSSLDFLEFLISFKNFDGFSMKKAKIYREYFHEVSAFYAN
jgi:hypothetical protein